jgi:hypothetical protein
MYQDLPESTVLPIKNYIKEKNAGNPAPRTIRMRKINPLTRAGQMWLEITYENSKNMGNSGPIP